MCLEGAYAGGRGGRSEFLAAAWSLSVSTPDQGEGDAPHTIGFPCRALMKSGYALGRVRENKVLVACFGYHLKSGHWKVDGAIHCPGGVLQRAGVFPLNVSRHSGPLDDNWLDNAWLCMHNHAGQGTSAGAEGREEEGGADDYARSWSSAASHARCRGPRKPSASSQVAITVRGVAERARDLLEGQVDALRKQLSACPRQEEQQRQLQWQQRPQQELQKAGRTPCTPTNPEGVRFWLASTLA